MTVLDDAASAASLLAVDPIGLGGACLRGPVHPIRDQWLWLLRDLMPETAPFRRIPFNTPVGRLLGGLDLAATLKARRPIAELGVLAASDGGVVVISMAERLAADSAAHLSSVLDAGEVAMPREGVLLNHPARLGIVALDEGIADDEQAPHSLRDRLAFLLDLRGVRMRAQLLAANQPYETASARELLPDIDMQEDYIESLCATALALDCGSIRASLLACRAARASAALAARSRVAESDVVLAGRLVLAPRATKLPAAPHDTSAQSDPGVTSAEQPSAETAEDAHSESQTGGQGELESRILAAARAAIPAGLLAAINAGAVSRGAAAPGGRAGALRLGGARGRPAGVRSGTPRSGARLNVIETLRAAAPWQPLRRRPLMDGAGIRIEAADFRVTHHKQRTKTLTIFAVDASGSAALNRLAEAKGAVELLLADCYIRRDEVAVIAFRGRAAELILSPTRSLLRAKLGLAGLPGGGGTPLAAAIDAAGALAQQATRRGDTPTVILLSDGRANVSRDGAPGREGAHRDALSAARALRLLSVKSLFIDTAPQPSSIASEIAAAMNARYVPLPFADARAVSTLAKVAVNAGR